MAHVSAHFRNIRESHDFSRDVTVLFGSAQAADEVLKGITFVLAREPMEAGVIPVAQGVYLLKTHPVPIVGGARPLLIVFSFDTNFVDLLRVV